MRRLRNIARAAALAAAMATATLAGAQALDTQGGRSIELTDRFDPQWLGDESLYTNTYGLDSVLKGARLFVDGPAKLSFTLVGMETPGDDRWGRFFDRPQPWKLGDSESFQQASAGLIDIAALIDAYAGACFTGISRKFSVALAEDNSSALLFFNTGFGWPDHDDVIVRLTVTPVPEPESALLWLAGLAGLGGWLRHRRSSKASV